MQRGSGEDAGGIVPAVEEVRGQVECAKKVPSAANGRRDVERKLQDDKEQGRSLVCRTKV